MLGLLRLWLLWRVARIVVPLLMLLALVSAFDRHARHPARLPAPPISGSLTRLIARDTGQLLARSRRQLARSLKDGPPSR